MSSAMKRSRGMVGAAILPYLIGGLALAGFGLWAWYGLCNGACQSAKADAEGWREQVVELDAKVQEQNRAVAAIRQEADNRIAAAAEAQKRAEAAIAPLTSRIQSLLAERPAYADKPCESACALLARPL